MKPRRLATRSAPVGIAVLVAVAVLGSAGGAVAGSMITGAQVKNGSLTGRDLRDGSVAGADVGDGSLSGGDVGDGSLTGGDVADGSLTGGDVADGSLSSRDLADVPAVWGAGSDQPASASADDGVQATTTFTTEKGFLHLTATLEAEDEAGSAGFGSVLYRVVVDGRRVTPVHHVEFTAPGATVPGALTAVVPVAAGQHTVALLTTEAGTGSVVQARELTVVYAPSGGGTVTVS
ncbi:hypothetical protein [Nocardioides daeguensis]|uniref:Pentapeptide repeat-containing protein n=1 Tax=Nocardioides daeguensis TaxID=908359 RepID=A0ABP6V8L1_9ACTN|nr:hypothetical protein [Nocardioides daeguensis]MBV6726418.1 hypothetical protein [Nocardioides daeguensis]MCR1772261.1 hypothetical protein [Nocardioides daeguensis]